jgi:polyhydroxyalkanoate synthase
MAEQQETPEHGQPGLLQVLGEITDNGQRLMRGIADRRCATHGASVSDPLNLGPAFLELSARVLADPALVLQAQLSLWQDYLRLWQNAGRRLLGQPVTPMIEPEQGDRRFRDPAWDDHAAFDFIKQSYLLTSRWLLDTVHRLHGFDDKTRRKIDFYTRQFVDAMSPSNFVATNPEVLRATMETRGANLLHGLNHLLEDLARGEGRLAIKMTDLEAFEVGGNLALSPGKVIYQNDLMQLLQYAPSTEEV